MTAKPNSRHKQEALELRQALPLGWKYPIGNGRYALSAPVTIGSVRDFMDENNLLLDEMAALLYRDEKRLGRALSLNSHCRDEPAPVTVNQLRTAGLRLERGLDFGSYNLEVRTLNDLGVLKKTARPKRKETSAQIARRYFMLEEKKGELP
jgi:hypothetical protein